MDHFSIVSAICRSSMKNPSAALINHVKKLIKALEKDNNLDQAESLRSILEAASVQTELEPSRVVLSRAALSGETLPLSLPPPVDRETGSYLAEIIHPRDNSLTMPIFDSELSSSVDNLLDEWKHIDLLKSSGIEPALSLMLFGDPGTGKTLLAHHISKQLDYPLIVAKLDGLLSSFLGTTARNISTLFNFANRYKCVLLLDEFDAIAKLRDDPNELGELKRVVNTLLQCLDERKNIGFTIAITNHEKLLDPAIWRRFDLRVSVPRPSKPARQQIIIHKFGSSNLADVELEFLVWLTEGYSGSDIEKLAFFLRRRLVILGEGFQFIESIREFIRLNANMPNLEVKQIVLQSDELLAKHLKSDGTFQLSQQSKLAELFHTTQSAVSRWLSK